MKLKNCYLNKKNSIYDANNQNFQHSKIRIYKFLTNLAQSRAITYYTYILFLNNNSWRLSAWLSQQFPYAQHPSSITGEKQIIRSNLNYANFAFWKYPAPLHKPGTKEFSFVKHQQREKEASTKWAMDLSREIRLTMAARIGERCCHYKCKSELAYHLDRSAHQVQAHPGTRK